MAAVAWVEVMPAFCMLLEEGVAALALAEGFAAPELAEAEEPLAPGAEVPVDADAEVVVSVEMAASAAM